MHREENRDYRVAVGAEPADRPISPLRADMIVSPQLFYGQLCFVMKDPVTLRYFRLQPVEHFLVTQFDGQKTARDLLGLIQQQFPESSLTVQDVLRFVGMLHESHLLVGEGLGHAEWLTKRRVAAKRKKWMELAQNFLFFKVPVFHPDRLLGFLDDTVGRVLFNPIAGIAALGLVLIALWNVLMSTDRLANLPYNLLSWQNLLILYGVFVCTKVFHEFGHGMAAKHFGGEVSSMGVMLFIITPSFYCDTSDAWMIPSRAARLWINAGGVVVELVIAALATFVWLYTPTDGVINQIALNTMISCSVATLFFNANPLLRYDGYYFLADLLEIPNLMTKGRQLVGYHLQKRVLNLKPTAPPDHGRTGWLVTYAVASSIYRWTVVFGIISLLYFFFSQFGLAPFGIILAVLYVVLTVLWPMFKTMGFVWKQRWDVGKRLVYMGGAAAVAAGVLGIVALLPWKHTIREPLVVLSASDEAVFVRTPGYVEKVVRDSGEAVKAGDVIMTLSDPSLETMMGEATSQLEAERMKANEAFAGNKPSEITAATDAINAYQQRIDAIKTRITNLTLRAPVDGVVVRDTSLRSIVGNFVMPGVTVCRVIRTDKLQARISLPQAQAALVKAGMPVKVRLWSNPSLPIQSYVSRVSSTVSDQLLHPALGSEVKGDVDVKADEKGQVKSTNRRSTVFVNLPSDTGFLADGMTGRGEIVVERSTNVAQRVWRAILDSTTPDLRL